MPLRAIFRGQDLLAPLLADDEWEQLRDDLRAEPLALVLPCCQQPGGLRTSKLGTRHFVHRPGAPCARTGETFQHLKLKADIVLACQEAGYAATTEVAGADWRADVLATRERTQIAFEVQWSPQDLPTTEFRQERYRRAGIRACWFFRKLPSWTPRQDLPMFQVRWDADQASGAVQFHQHRVPLGQFVQALLNRRLKFCAQLREADQQTIQVLFALARCGRCGNLAHWYAVPHALRSRCGLEMVASATLPRPALRQAIDDFIASQQPGLTVGRLSIDADPVTGQPRSVFLCPQCEAPFRLLIPWSPRTRPASTLTLQTTITLQNPGLLPGEHWCFAADGRFCDP